MPPLFHSTRCASLSFYLSTSSDASQVQNRSSTLFERDWSVGLGGFVKNTRQQRKKTGHNFVFSIEERTFSLTRNRGDNSCENAVKVEFPITTYWQIMLRSSPASDNVGVKIKLIFTCERTNATYRTRRSLTETIERDGEGERGGNRDWSIESYSLISVYLTRRKFYFNWERFANDAKKKQEETKGEKRRKSACDLIYVWTAIVFSNTTITSTHWTSYFPLSPPAMTNNRKQTKKNKRKEMQEQQVVFGVRRLLVPTRDQSTQNRKKDLNCIIVMGLIANSVIIIVYWLLHFSSIVVNLLSLQQTKRVKRLPFSQLGDNDDVEQHRW